MQRLAAPFAEIAQWIYGIMPQQILYLKERPLSDRIAVFAGPAIELRKGIVASWPDPLWQESDTLSLDEGSFGNAWPIDEGWGAGALAAPPTRARAARPNGDR
jgi:hypothetical protein